MAVRTTRRALRAGRGGRPRPGTAVRRRPGRVPRDGAQRRGGIAALLAVIALLLVLLLRREVSAPPPPAPAPAAAAPAPAPAPPRRAKPPAPAPAFPSPRERLLAAIRDRAGDLAACEAPPGSPTRAPSRLAISRAGVPRSVAFEGAALPAALGACLRERILAWRFDRLELPSDVEVLVTFSLAPAR